MVKMNFWLVRRDLETGVTLKRGCRPATFHSFVKAMERGWIVIMVKRGLA